MSLAHSIAGPADSQQYAGAAAPKILASHQGKAGRRDATALLNQNDESRVKLFGGFWPRRSGAGILKLSDSLIDGQRILRFVFVYSAGIECDIKCDHIGTH